MCRGKRYSPMGASFDDRRGGRLGCEAVNGLHLYHVMAHGADDSPPARGGSRSHREGADELHPQCNIKSGCVQEMKPGWQVVEGLCLCCRSEQGQCDDSHGLLGII